MAVFTIKDAATVRDDILRTLRNGLIARGVANPQLGPASHEFVLATAVANEIAVVGANTQIKADEQMPDTATSSALDRICNQFGLARRTDGPSSGYVTLATSANSFIPIGAQLVDQAGSRFQVLVGGVYTNTSPFNLVPIGALDLGTKTNHVSGDVLKWTSTPPYAQPTALVTPAGLTGGVDAEGDEALRARLLSRLQNPPNNANWGQIAVFAEASSTAVQKAFVYPAANGPGTVHVAVTAPTQLLSASVTALISTSKNRDVDATLMAATVVPYIQGQLPEYVQSVITTVVNVPNDVSIGLSLPASTAAVPAGPGGGWLDAVPWPNNTNAASNFKCTITGVTSSTVITVDAPSAPTAGVSHICYLDPVNWTLYRARVLSYTGTAGAYVLTLDAPWPLVLANYYVFPDMVRAQAYTDAILAAFAAMGPGEKTANASNIVRGYRHPVPANSWPYTLNATQLRQLSNVGAEVLDVSWLYRTSSVAPLVPTSVATAPNIFTPRYVGFYPIV